MKKYWTIFITFFLFSIKAKLTYRLNLLFKLLYGPAYAAVLFLILMIAYSKTNTLSGWNKQDAIILFSVFNLIYTNCLIIFMDAIRYMLWTGIRLGEVDSWLVKPGSAQFYLSFSRPNTDLLSLWVCVFLLFCVQISRLPTLPLTDWLAFILLFVLAHCIVYLSLSTYATFGFYITRAQQMIELYDKGADFAQYPLSIFPQSVQLIMVTFLPIAYFSYIPTLFLRGEGSWEWVVLTIVTTLVLYFLNRYSWRHALREYSSASS